MVERKISFLQLPLSHGGKIFQQLSELDLPDKDALDSQLLCFEPDALNIDTGLPVLEKRTAKRRSVLLVGKVKTVWEDCDILVVGGGMAGTGAAYEARYWGRDMKIVCAEKANIDRSGAVAQGLYAINCYMGMQWDENQPEDHVRYARNDLMGLVREDLAFDMARHVDSAVHKFEEWGLPIMRNEKTGHYQREGKWQIMIHGESYQADRC